ncbi:MAG: DUF3071 domain-containing protein [Streptosporangiales bacterium]|nr:DUF3071 domain-containing protein [Streptosporangiales bacterium]
MQELRLVGISDDGEFLLLAAPDATGAHFRVPIDGRVRAAVRGDHERSGRPETQMETTVRPKEIQARIRGGQSPEEVASAAGLPLERIEAFATPVIRERMHIAEVAQRTAVRRPGESQPGPELGELVRQRLQARGVAPEDQEWDAWRRDDGSWKVRLHYKMANRTGAAEWIYDVSARHVRPVDDEAATLVSANGSAHLQAEAEPEPEEVIERPRLAAVSGGADAAPTVSVPTQEPLSQDEQTTEPLRIASQQNNNKSSKRASVPSWDEIIFGTRRQRD